MKSIWICILCFVVNCSKPFPDSSLIPFLGNGLLRTNSGTFVVAEGTMQLSGGSTLDFSTVRLKASSVKTISIQNTGTQAVSISSIISNNTEFIVSAIPSEIASGQTASVTISFVPTSVGEKTATLTITSNASSNLSFSLKGVSIPDKFIFITTGTYNGNRGGVTGADSTCTNEKNNNYSSLPTGVYKAMLVDGASRIACSTANCGGGVSENFNWVLKPSQSYYHPITNALVFTTNAKSILDFPMNSLLDANAGKFWWTGIDSDWTDPNDNCNSWASTGVTGYTGKGGELTVGFVSRGLAGSTICTTNLHLVCVEQ